MSNRILKPALAVALALSGLIVGSSLEWIWLATLALLMWTPAIFWLGWGLGRAVQDVRSPFVWRGEQQQQQRVRKTSAAMPLFKSEDLVPDDDEDDVYHQAQQRVMYK